VRQVASALGYPLLTVAAIAALWIVATDVLRVPSYLFPPLPLVLAKFGTSGGLLLMHARTTVGEIAAGFALTLAIGLPLSLAIASWPLLDRLVYPILVASQTTPKVAIAPLLVVWMGFGIAPKIFMVVIVAFFPLVISSVVGFKSTPSEMIRLGRSMGLSRLAMFTKVTLPHALPEVLAGVKVAITLAVIGAVIGEFVGADSGLGYLLMSALSRLDMELMFADLIVLILIGVVLFGIVAGLERILIPWHVSVRRNDAVSARLS